MTDKYISSTFTTLSNLAYFLPLAKCIHSRDSFSFLYWSQLALISTLYHGESSWNGACSEEYPCLFSGAFLRTLDHIVCYSGLLWIALYFNRMIKPQIKFVVLQIIMWLYVLFVTQETMERENWQGPSASNENDFDVLKMSQMDLGQMIWKLTHLLIIRLVNPNKDPIGLLFWFIVLPLASLVLAGNYYYATSAKRAKEKRQAIMTYKENRAGVFDARFAIVAFLLTFPASYFFLNDRSSNYPLYHGIWHIFSACTSFFLLNSIESTFHEDSINDLTNTGLHNSYYQLS